MNDKLEQSESILVRSENLDRLLMLAGEVIVASSNIGLLYRRLQSLFDSKQPIDKDTVDDVKDLSISTSEISSSLHRLVQSIRTVSLRDLSFRTRRLARDLARKGGKRFQFRVTGESTVVDKTIAEKLFDPVAHQLRNAIDHGIEDVSTRVSHGKSEEGEVTLRMYNTEQDTCIEIEDDGQGINLEGLRQKAISAGLLRESDSYDNEIALEVMSTPGITTVERVTEISGRGVGMDVVKGAISKLDGTISFRTEKNKGTIFIFRVPLVSAVNIIDALVVESGGVMYAFPILSVVSTMFVAPEAINTTMGKGKTLKHLNQLITLYNLDTLLTGRTRDHNTEKISVLVIEHKGTKIALAVDAFGAPQKLVIIPMNETLPIPALSGATILGGRRLGFIMHVPVLINMAQGRRLQQQREKIETKDSDASFSAEQGAESEAKEHVESRDLVLEKNEGETREFLQEIERLIPQLNEALFALESSPASEEHMNSAFRLFHTIKGNFMIISLPKGGTTIHSVESVLDSARSRHINITPDVMDLLMDGASYIEEAVRLSIDGRWEDNVRKDILDKSKQLLASDRPVDEKSDENVDSAEVILSHEAAYRAIIYRKRKTPCYRCYLEFNPGPQPAFLLACLIYRRFCDIGDVLGTIPTLSGIEKSAAGGPMKLLFASDIAREIIEETLNRLLRQHYGVDVLELTRIE
ncbi:MAG: ATP-binding protein [Pseudomonadota bacterium]